MTRQQRVMALGCALVAVGVGTGSLLGLQAQGAVPRYEVDESWPLPLPDRWVLGPLGGVCVDAQDHVFLLNRQEVIDPDLNAGQKAPPVIEFDPAGRVVNSWRDDLFSAPLINSFHACHVDADNNVWIVSFESGIVRKYSHDGSKLLLQIGKSDVVDSSDGTEKGKALNSNAAQFFAPADIAVDRQNGDVYVDDGGGEYGEGNRRIAVMDRSGKFLRQWQPQGRGSMHCMELAHDGLLYVCDRPANRLQVSDKMGKFIKAIEIPWKPYTPVSPGEKRGTGSGGAAVSIAFSHDSNQRLMFVINQNNSQIEIVERSTGKMLSSFGRPGRYPGTFDQPLDIASDSRGNLYVTENRGRRLQKFRPVGQ